MLAIELDEIKIRAEEIIKKAGELFIDIIIEKEHIIEKGHANYVTVIDYKVQEFLAEELHKITPNCNIIAEESDRNQYNLKEATWVIDPVDGTTNLMYDFHHSAISAGLFVDGKPTLGFVYNPTAGELFFAQEGKGAFLNGRPIEVTKNSNIQDALIGFGTTPYDREKASRTFDITKNIILDCRDVRRTGSAALDLAYVACGRLDAFFELVLQPWDFAAGMIILQEAGGRITDLTGSELNVLRPCSVAASNSRIHDRLLMYFNQ